VPAELHPGPPVVKVRLERPEVFTLGATEAVLGSHAVLSGAGRHAEPTEDGLCSPRVAHRRVHHGRDGLEYNVSLIEKLALLEL
jgi:hypothetical protein